MSDSGAPIITATNSDDRDNIPVNKLSLIGEALESKETAVSNEILDDCPLCCSEMTLGDTRYPLYCPTVTCNYNFCLNCINRFMLAASDGYQIASDGSNQMKVAVRCPMCRSKYQSATPPANKYSSEIIIQSVLLLRTAVFVEKLIGTSDCELNASDLSKKTLFIMETSMEELEDAYSRLQVYQGSLLSSPEVCSGDDDQLKRSFLQRKNDDQGTCLYLRFSQHFLCLRYIRKLSTKCLKPILYDWFLSIGTCTAVFYVIKELLSVVAPRLLMRTLVQMVEQVHATF